MGLFVCSILKVTWQLLCCLFSGERRKWFPSNTSHPSPPNHLRNCHSIAAKFFVPGHTVPDASWSERDISFRVFSKGPYALGEFLFTCKNICHQFHFTSADAGFDSYQILSNTTKLQKRCRPALEQDKFLSHFW